MLARRIVLGMSLALIGLLAFLTLDVMANQGVDVLVVVSLIVLAMLGFGVIGAMATPPDD